MLQLGVRLRLRLERIVGPGGYLVPARKGEPQGFADSSIIMILALENSAFDETQLRFRTHERASAQGKHSALRPRHFLRCR